MNDMKDYLELGIAGFKHDPADTDFQKGYLMAMKDALDYLEELIENSG